MPGITGIIRKHLSDETLRDLRLMVGVMQHEQDYATREYINHDLGLCVAWTGHQTAAVSSMPIMNRNRDVVLIFQGENYADLETSAEMRRAGVAWENSGLAYLLDNFEHDETELLRRLNGWFCGILADLRRKTVTLFNDRFGMSRLYFYEGQDEFLFSSEAKSLLKVRPDLRRMNPASLAQFLRANCVMGNQTLFEKINLLPQGAGWIFQDGTLSRKRRYFQFKEWEELPKQTEHEFHSKIFGNCFHHVPEICRKPAESRHVADGGSGHPGDNGSAAIQPPVAALLYFWRNLGRNSRYSHGPENRQFHGPDP